VWQHVFARPRPALQELVVSEVAMMADVMQSRDVESMVAACPGLKPLTVNRSYGHGVSTAEAEQTSQLLAPLSRLSQLSD
jgi:hypothetical protein